MLRDGARLPAAEHPLHLRRGLGLLRQNKADDVSLDAAVISQIVGKPIRVAYMREDEHAWENYGQAYTITITGCGRHFGGQGEGHRLEARRVDVHPR